MHIKLLYRKVLYVFLSLMIVISSTQSAFANSAGWSIQSTVMNGATAAITAIKGSGSSALRSVIAHKPLAVNVGKNLLQGGGAIALAYAASQLLDAGVDWVLDPANNGITYKNPPPDATAGGYTINGGCTQNIFSTGQAVCSSIGKTFVARADWPGNTCDGSASHRVIYSSSPLCAGAVLPDTYTTIPINTVAAKVISNADAGHSPSQELLKTVAVADVNSGALDTELDSKAVPVSDPVDPTDPTSPSFDPSSIIAALQSLMSAITNMSASIKQSILSMSTLLSDKIDQMIGKQTETNQVINDGMADVVAANNATGARVGDVVAAIEALEGNTLDGKVINDAIDRAIAAGHTDTASIVAAIEAIEGNTLDGQVINDAVDRVIASDSANAQATQDVVSDSIDKAIEESHVDAGTVSDAVTDGATATTEAIKEQTDAISQADPVTGETSLKLPSFCGWAGTVCDYMDWVKGEYQTMSDFVKAEPETMPDEPVVVADDPSGLGDVFRDKAEAGYVSFSRECPANVLIPVSLMGASQSLNISYAPFCHFASLIRPAVILGAWISGLLIISGGRARE